MTYIDKLAEEIGARCNMSMGLPEERRLLRLYAVIGMAKGVDTTCQDVHDAWAAWRLETRPDHPAVVLFSSLTPEARALDEPYRDAIRGAVLVTGHWR